MAIVVTERWSDRKLVVGQSAQRAWDVTGVADEADALVQVLSLCDYNAAFPQDSRLTGGRPEVTRTGPVSFRITAPFSYKPGRGTPNLSANPLDLPPRMLWEPAELTESTDIDAYDTPITNSGGFPVSPAPPGEFPYRVLTVTRWESTYDLDLAERYEGTTNSDQVRIPKTPGPVDVGRMLLKTYRPLQDYDISSPYVQAAYTFWLRKGVKKDSDGIWDAWKHRIMDRGYSGWFNDSGTPKIGAFVSAGDHQAPAEPVLLDGTGKPLNAGAFLVRHQANPTSQPSYETPIAAPTTLSGVLLENAGNAFFLKYRRHRTAPFSGLNLF